MLRKLFIGSVLGLALLASAVGRAQIVSGRVTVVDGDSLAMTGASIRLFGIDAPESRQTCERNGIAWNCGEDATQLLSSLVEGKEVRCEQQDTDRYGRLVARCYVDDLDLSRQMVGSGMALALPEFTDAYVELEARAKQHRIGLWGSKFEPPAAWRIANKPDEQRRIVAPAVSRPVPLPSRVYRNSLGCAVKGNRNRRGQWIYHLPGMPYYDATRPEELFCTEAEAQAAGYRRAIVK